MLLSLHTMSLNAKNAFPANNNGICRRHRLVAALDMQSPTFDFELALAVRHVLPAMDGLLGRTWRIRQPATLKMLRNPDIRNCRTSYWTADPETYDDYRLQLSVCTNPGRLNQARQVGAANLDNLARHLHRQWPQYIQLDHDLAWQHSVMPPPAVDRPAMVASITYAMGQPR